MFHSSMFFFLFEHFVEHSENEGRLSSSHECFVPDLKVHCIEAQKIHE